MPSPINCDLSSAELFGPALHRYLAGILQRYLSHYHSCLPDDFSVNHDGDSTSRHEPLERWPASHHARSLSHPRPAPGGGQALACVARDHHSGLCTPGVEALPQTTPLWAETSEVPTFREIMRGRAPLGLHPRTAALHRGDTLMAGGLGDSVLSHQTVYNDLA